MLYHRLCVAAVAAHELSNLLHWYLIVEWQDPTFSNRYSVTHQKLVTALLQVRKGKSVLNYGFHWMSGASPKRSCKGMPRLLSGANVSEIWGNWQPAMKANPLSLIRVWSWTSSISKGASDCVELYNPCVVKLHFETDVSCRN
jgi:hypothetical protein